jgi:hypothetical protein
VASAVPGELISHHNLARPGSYALNCPHRAGTPAGSSTRRPEPLGIERGFTSVMQGSAVRFWVDEPSCSVLAFVVRRLAAESAVMLIVVREGLASVFDDADLPELRLAGLTEDAARGLLDFRGQGVLSSLFP